MSSNSARLGEGSAAGRRKHTV